MSEKKEHGKLVEKKAPAPPPIPKPSFAWEGPPALVVVGGAGLTIGSRLNLQNGSTVLGRAPDTDIPVLDGSVSRRHAEFLVAEGAEATVIDLGSKHGTFVNDAPVSIPVELSDGDYVRCGNVVFKFRTAKPGAATGKSTSDAPKEPKRPSKSKISKVARAPRVSQTDPTDVGPAAPSEAATQVLPPKR